MKRLSILFAAFCMFFAVASVAGAQQFDLAFGFGTTGGSPASDASAANIAAGTATAQSIGGGGYPAFSGDFLFFRRYAGVSAEVAWRASRNNNLFTQPYRPILYDFNFMFAPPLGKRAQAELQAGIGAQSVRFYTPFFTCSSGFFANCTNYTTSNHFLGHYAGAIRFYLTKSIFIRPEYHLYTVRNNVEFAGPLVTRYGVSIGYSLKNQF